jgi:hypothetical protein
MTRVRLTPTTLAPAIGVTGDAAGFHLHPEFHRPLRPPNLPDLTGPETGGGRHHLPRPW